MRRALLVLALIAVPASAQEPTTDQKAQACISKLLETTQRELDVRAQAIAWQHALNAAQERVKALEDKYEPKQAPPPKPQ